MIRKTPDGDFTDRGFKVLTERETIAVFDHFRVPEWAREKIRRRFHHVAVTNESEAFACQHCGRLFGEAEVCKIVDPDILLEHPVPGYGYDRAEPESGRWLKWQCALDDE